MPLVCYHVAPVAERPAIERDGLIASEPAGGYPAGVYMFADRENAGFFAEHMSAFDRDEYGSSDSGREIWLVQTEGLALRPDPAVSDADEFQGEYPVQPLRSFYSPAPVGPERLSGDDGT
jgi:hypothetical protein